MSLIFVQLQINLVAWKEIQFNPKLWGFHVTPLVGSRSAAASQFFITFYMKSVLKNDTLPQNETLKIPEYAQNSPFVNWLYWTRSLVCLWLWTSRLGHWAHTVDIALLRLVQLTNKQYDETSVRVIKCGKTSSSWSTPWSTMGRSQDALCKVYAQQGSTKDSYIASHCQLVLRQHTTTSV